MLRFNRRPEAVTIAIFLIAITGFAQSSTTAEQAKAAFTSKAFINGVTLDRIFVSVEGSSRQQGDARLVVGSDGTYSVALSKNAGVKGEARSRTEPNVECSWTDSRGNNRAIDLFNCLIPAWFLLEVPLLLASKATAEWTLSAQTTEGSIPHLKFTHQTGAATGQDPPLESSIDIELSNTTLLPTKTRFFTHPDGRSYVNIPVEITYEDYRQIDGLSIPYHVQKFVNGTLVLDITISSANVN